ncbi:SCP2 sterol-binding domain-containing protein [Roseospira marina]|uniref:SCP2 sterol-binding domain-containing protein n=1 Tax=Roseospira marina TaxID=140057 RepID=A0A5M6IER3_9PROT|nr:SCP2 sterol-binding domain-containing protein [Roseospira marina]KAA5606038.1 SCP2 sterol-binding domain-containing protein [Roseospira marina]MBB4313101.1 putative sterol carrier protein [Roseospira marina]MBB5086158.1 putative sterol carrier protein [Roseospira marina]
MDTVEERLRDALPRLNRLGYIVRFAVSDDDTWIVDGRATTAELLPDDDRETACTIKITKDNLFRLLDGKLDPMVGYSLGKIKVLGSKGVAMKLVSTLS